MCVCVFWFIWLNVCAGFSRNHQQQDESCYFQVGYFSLAFSLWPKTSNRSKHTQFNQFLLNILIHREGIFRINYTCHNFYEYSRALKTGKGEKKARKDIQCDFIALSPIEFPELCVTWRPYNKLMIVYGFLPVSINWKEYKSIGVEMLKISHSFFSCVIHLLNSKNERGVEAKSNSTDSANVIAINLYAFNLSIGLLINVKHTFVNERDSHIVKINKAHKKLFINVLWSFQYSISIFAFFLSLFPRLNATHQQSTNENNE